MSEDIDDDVPFPDEMVDAIVQLQYIEGLRPREISELLGVDHDELVSLLERIELYQYQKKLDIHAAHGEEIIFSPEGLERTRRKFSTHHLTAAIHNARIAGLIENKVENRKNSEIVNGVEAGRLRTIHDSHVVTSLISSYQLL